MGSPLEYSKGPPVRSGVRQPFDREKWQLLESQPRLSARERQQLAKAEFCIGRMKMQNANEKKAAGDLRGAADLLDGAVGNFRKALLYGPESRLKKDIEIKLKEALILQQAGAAVQQ